MSTPAETPIPCPVCGFAPVIKQEPEVPNPIEGVRFYMACSNEWDCPVWPMTYCHDTPEQAISAWNAGQTH